MNMDSLVFLFVILHVFSSSIHWFLYDENHRKILRYYTFLQHQIGEITTYTIWASLILLWIFKFILDMI